MMSVKGELDGADMQTLADSSGAEADAFGGVEQSIDFYISYRCVPCKHSTICGKTRRYGLGVRDDVYRDVHVISYITYISYIQQKSSFGGGTRFCNPRSPIHFVGTRRPTVPL